MDCLVHERLRERRFVALVVAMSSVPDQVDQEILVKFLSVCCRYPAGFYARSRVVGVDMNYRDLKPFRKVAGVPCASRLVWRGGVSQLIVRDNVYRAAGRVPFKAREVESLCYYPLSRE